ncbi:MAG: nucleotidyltransferase domain-containing protein [Thermodesulfobacteriota bacterium]|nr:nucleotidyltransferase domain-containing protein [Thermodesulfobacteriota bacterium]
MAKINRPEEIFTDITEDYRKIYSDALLSVILYGSAAGGDYRPGKSDLNFLIVLSEKSIDRLDKAIETVLKWRKKNVSTPLFMTESYIASSLDSYPLEFLNMRKEYVLVYGKDVLKDISIESSHLRLQCEREIKGKLLLLRERFLETEGKPSRIRALTGESITAFVSIFRGLLYLKGVEIPSSKREIVETLAREIPVDENVFMNCLNMKEEKKKFATSEINAIFMAYLMEVRRLWEFVEELE